MPSMGAIGLGTQPGRCESNAYLGTIHYESVGLLCALAQISDSKQGGQVILE